ncbi:MAG TPA: hypothetical protein VGM81_05295 [Burkholderiaceae bacterium]|jgi:hypothetical protein
MSSRHQQSRQRSRLARLTVLVTALSLATFSMGAQAQLSADAVKSLINALTGQGQPQNQPGRPPRQMPLNLSPQAAAAVAAANQQARMPITPATAALFAKGTVRGDELIGVLNLIRAEMRQRKSAEALAAMVAATDMGAASLASGNSGGLSSLFGDVFTKAATTLLKQTVSGVALHALDDYLARMIDDPQALAAETITLPPGVGLTEGQARRILTVAGLTVGARVTAKLLERTQKDLEGLRVDYGKLIDRREQAAKLLFAAITERNKLGGAEGGEDQSQLRASLNADDLAFVDKDLAGMTVSQFSKDLAAQNLALSYLQKANPQQFAGYRTEADDVVRRTKAYLRTMTGIAAFGALTVSFTHSVAEIAREKQAASLLQSLPLMKDFIVAAAPLAPMSIETALKGVDLSTGQSGGFIASIFNRKKAFLFVDAGKPQELVDAKDVFTAMKKSPDPTELFKGALFRNDAPGMLLRVGECDRVEAGRMFDASVPQSDREAFARSYFGSAGAEKADGFSFVNAFDDASPVNAGEQGLALRLLGEDHRLRSSDQTLALARIQQKVSDRYDEWGNAQLMRLIFVNREGQARHATLYLGDTQIRPIPSAESVYAYETAAEACKKLLAPPKAVVAKPAPAPATKAPAPKPAAKKTPPPKKDTK